MWANAGLTFVSRVVFPGETPGADSAISRQSLDQSASSGDRDNEVRSEIRDDPEALEVPQLEAALLDLSLNALDATPKHRRIQLGREVTPRTCSSTSRTVVAGFQRTM